MIDMGKEVKIFDAGNDEKIVAFIFAALCLGVIFFIIIQTGIEKGKLFSFDYLFTIGTWILLSGIIFYDLHTQKIELTNTTLRYTDDFYFKKNLNLEDIVSVQIIYGEKRRRNLLLTLKDNSSVEIKMSIWAEDAFLNLFDELRRKNPSIDFDDRYDPALAALGTPKYEVEKDLIRNEHSKNLSKFFIWSLLTTLLPLALILVSKMFE